MCVILKADSWDTCSLCRGTSWGFLFPGGVKWMRCIYDKSLIMSAGVASFISRALSSGYSSSPRKPGWDLEGEGFFQKRQNAELFSELCPLFLRSIKTTPGLCQQWEKLYKDVSLSTKSLWVKKTYLWHLKQLSEIRRNKGKFYFICNS